MRLKRFALWLTAILAFLMIIPVNAASKKTMYVVTSIKRVHNPYTYTYTIKYNKNGLLEECSSGYTKGCKYDKNGVLKQEGDKVYTIKKGVRVKGVTPSTTYKYKWKNGQCVEVKSGNVRYTYAYDSKGNMTKEEVYIDNVLTYTYAYTYNNKGHRLTYDFWSKSGGLSSTAYELKYKNGRLKTVEHKSASLNATITYTYSKVKVPKKLVEKVNAQQQYILNEWRVKKGYILNEFFG